MKILNFWMVALMALSLSSTFVSCSDNDDDEPNFAKEIAGAYKGYSVGACNMFSDYLLVMNPQQQSLPTKDERHQFSI